MKLSKKEMEKMHRMSEDICKEIMKKTQVDEENFNYTLGLVTLVQTTTSFALAAADTREEINDVKNTLTMLIDIFFEKYAKLRKNYIKEKNEK